MSDMNDVAIFFVVIGPVQPPVRLAPLLQVFVGHLASLAVLISRCVDSGIENRSGSRAVLSHLGQKC